VPPDDDNKDDPFVGEDPPGVILVDPPFDGVPPNGVRPTRYVVDNVEVRVATERVQYLDASGKLITESLKDYSRKTVRQAYASLDAFLTAWNDAEKKQAILDELATQGVFLDELALQVGRDYDAFDLICHVAFDAPPLTRKERAEKVKKRDVFGKYGAKSRAVLDALLQKYSDSGIASLESLEILKVDPLTAFGTPVEIVSLFGGKSSYLTAIRELEAALYRGAA
jgi:type I restriction enzyme R subunit